MKKIIMIVMTLVVCLLPSVTYAESEAVYVIDTSGEVLENISVYDIYIDGVKQPFDALYSGWDLLLPMKKIHQKFGATSTFSDDASIETLRLGDEIIEINRAENEMIVSGTGPAFTTECGEINGVLYVLTSDYQYKMQNIVIPVDSKKEVHILTLKGTEQKLEARNDLFKIQSPDLYSAFEKMIATAYSFDYDVNVDVKMIASENTTTSIPFDKLSLAMKSNGYVNLLKDNLDLTFDMAMNAGPSLQESIEGARVMLIKNMMYLYDPQWDDWDSEEILDRRQYNEAKELLSESNNASAWLLVDHITETEETDGSVIYKAIIKGEELEEAVDAITFEGYYQIMVDFLEEERMFVTIENIEFTYVIKDGKMTDQKLVMNLDMSVEGVKMDLNISGNGEFYSYGQVKDLVLPREFRPSLQPKFN